MVTVQPVPVLTITTAQPSQPENLACELKPAESSKPKPCCVCKEEKSARDECMLFSQADDPQEDCKGMVQKYRDCMKGFGFNIA